MLAAGAALVLGCFTVGVFAVRSTTEGLMLIGLLACFIVFLTGPQRMVSLALFLTFASLPAALHIGKVLGPISIYTYQVALVLAILFLIPAARLRFSRYTLPLMFLLTVLGFTAAGMARGNDLEATLREASFLCEVVAGFVLALLVVRTDYVKQSIRTMGVVMWFSACMIVLSSLTGLRLAGRSESLEGETGAAAIRILTATQAPALAVLTALVVASILGRAKPAMWLSLGFPALAITLLGFSRHTLIALAVAVTVAIAMNVNWAVIRRSSVAIVVGMAALTVVVPAALFLLQESGPGVWLSDQVNAFTHRVFEGSTTTALVADPSTLARLQENTNLEHGIGQSPLFGHGLGYAFQKPWGNPDDFTATLGTTYAHNFYLWWLVKAGALGMAAFAIFALVPVVKAIRTATTASTIAASVGMALLVTCIVNPLPLEPSSSLTLGITLGAALAFSRSGARVPSAAVSPAQRPIRPIAARVAHTTG